MHGYIGRFILSLAIGLGLVSSGSQLAFATTLSSYTEYLGSTFSKNAGRVVVNVGDVDGDGYSDFMVSAPFVDGSSQSEAGATYLIYGGPDSVLVNQNLLDYPVFVGQSNEAGRSVAGAGDINDDGYSDMIIGSSGTNSGDHTGIIYLVYGQPTRFTGVVELGATSFLGENVDDYAGWSLSGAGDINNDGFSDFVIGAPNASPNAEQSGAVYLIYGQSEKYLGEYSLSTIAEFQGSAIGDQAGYCVAGVGDVNNDGFADLAVGTIGDDTAAANAGAVHLIYGKIGKYTGNRQLSNFAKFTGEASGDELCRLAGNGDVNNDGYDDLLLGAAQNDDGGALAGATYILYGRSSVYSSTQSVSTLAEFSGENAGDNFGYSLGIGDVNGDAYADILVGASGEDSGGASAGASYLFYGQATQYSGTITASVGTVLTGEAAGDQSGASVGMIDYNADNYTDLLIGAHGNDEGAASAGAAYLVYAYVDADDDTVPGLAGLLDGADCNDDDASVSAEQDYYLDSDNDGLGSDTITTICSATAPVGYVNNSNDTDDTVFNENLDADGDGVLASNDCDDQNAAVTELQRYYVDADGDGLGNPILPELQCSAEPADGYVSNANDTDDTTFGQIDSLHVKNNGKLKIYYQSGAQQTVDPFISSAKNYRAAVSSDRLRVIVTNGKLVKVFREGVKQTTKHIYKHKTQRKFTKLKMVTFYSGYDTVVIGMARGQQGRVVVLRLTTDDQLRKKQLNRVDLLRTIRQRIKLRTYSQRQDFTAIFDQSDYRTQHSYHLKANGRLLAE